jgi:hypothetical protein
MRLPRALAPAIGGLAAIALAVPAMAGPDPFEREYEGRAERDPNTFVGFDVSGTGDSRKVGEVTALVTYGCDNGDGGDAAGTVEGKLKVEDDRFRGTLRGTPLPFRAAAARGPGPSRIKYRIKGRFGKRGKARGTLDATLTFTPTRGTNLVRCYTGELDWKARRGADVFVPS